MTTNLEAELTCEWGLNHVAKKVKRLSRRITARKAGGDDLASWAVFIDGRQFVNGLTRPEVPHYRRQALDYLLKN